MENIFAFISNLAGSRASKEPEFGEWVKRTLTSALRI